MPVSETKKLFHEQFPYVIPGLYKRLVDEMLVELNLLNHQNEFNQDKLFCVGLQETFNELTKGYKPAEHRELLFDSICKAANFEPTKIKEISQKTLEEFQNKSLKEIHKLLTESIKPDLYPSRILNLGIYTIISNAKDFNESKDSDISNVISETINNLKLSINKAEKDIGLYKSSIIKLKQAKELIEETKIKDKKKS